MTAEDKIHSYARRCNLMDEDVEYLLALLREAAKEEREACAQLVERQSLESYGHVSRTREALNKLADAIRHREAIGAP